MKSSPAKVADSKADDMTSVMANCACVLKHSNNPSNPALHKLLMRYYHLRICPNSVTRSVPQRLLQVLQFQFHLVCIVDRIRYNSPNQAAETVPEPGHDLAG